MVVVLSCDLFLILSLDNNDVINYDSFIQEPQNEHAKLMNLSSIGRSVSSPGSVDSPTTQLSQPQGKYYCKCIQYSTFTYVLTRST